MKPTIWHGCYDKSLKGFITDQSFGHPAKYSLGLIERIFDHCIKQGYLSRGDVVGDCFGGVCIGGLVAAYRGLEWQGVELEPRFVQWCEDNIALHRSKFKALGVMPPRITQGDSRAFHVLIGETDAMVSSPPYADSIDRPSGIDPSKVQKPGGPNGNTHMDIYGKASGQIGRLKSGAVDGVISSPPYAGISPEKSSKSVDLLKQYRTYRESGGGASYPAFIATQEKHSQGYGKSVGQISTLKEGTVAGVISSPPYAEALAHGGGPDTKQDLIQGGKSLLAIKAGYGETEGNIGSCRVGEVAAVVSSPPYAVISTGAGGLNTKPAKHEGQQSGRSANAASQDTDQKYGTAEGQIARLKGGSVDGIVSSPPFRDGRSDTTKARATKGGGPCAERLHSVQAGTTYGESDGQIDNLKTGDVDAVVTSPPWESNSEGGVKASKFNYTLADTKGHGSTPAAKKRAMERDEQKVYGDSEGQIGKEKGETYWQAMDQVYRSCFQAIKPGGVIVLVVKDYCKGGKRVRLCDDTMRLLEHIGFTPLERIHAMLVSETVVGWSIRRRANQTPAQELFPPTVRGWHTRGR